jgi:RND family efflux transporter MFP subunit
MRIHTLELRLRTLVGASMMVGAIASCGSKSTPATTAAVPPVDVASENVAVADSATVESGPAISGTLTPDRSAQLKAQAAGTIEGMYVDEGGVVHAGQMLALIDTLSLAEAARSARSQLTSAKLAADVAKRNYDRNVNLHAAGAIADRDLEVAHNQSVAADAAVADAQSKLTTAERQLSNAIVRAPFNGQVSTRPANTGDVLQVGNPIMTIVDPSELELDASVGADFISKIKIGTKVDFSVNGNPGHTFPGHVARINPTVDTVTRQVRLYITVPNQDRSLAGGLFAQGRVALSVVHGIAIPTAALDARTASTMVHRVRGGKIEDVNVSLGVRDDLAERVQVLSGLSVGDTVLLSAALGTPAGTSVRVTQGDH